MRKVAITGMGIVSPLGNDIASFWQALLDGVCGITPITRFDASDLKASLAAEVKEFDPTEYMEKNDARRRDLNCQYAMAAASQAMEDSGVEGTLPSERLGVYFGSGIGGIITFQSEVEKLVEKGPKRISPYFIPMLIANMASAEIAIRYQAKGPCLPVVTACATSSNSIGEAYRAIAHGYADAILCGGTEAAITRIGIAGFVNMMALTTANDPMAASLPFDSRRGGFVMGEGSGALVLEDYDHARNRGATIYGLIGGYGTTCDAYHITAPPPDAEGAARAITQAVEEAGGSAGRQLYINAHGTGTPLNDVAETMAIKRALGEQAMSTPVSSTKSMTGHMLGASGAAEAIVSLLALRDQVAPPTINLLQPDPACDLDYVPLHARKMPLDMALSISLGFGGHNACLAFTGE